MDMDFKIALLVSNIDTYLYGAETDLFLAIPKLEGGTAARINYHLALPALSKVGLSPSFHRINRSQ